MKYNYLVRVLLLSFLIAWSVQLLAQYKCTIKGTVINRKSTTLILLKKTEDIRHAGIEIPIVNNSFEHTFISATPEAYELTFKDESDAGSWRPITFFPYKGVLNMTLYPMDDWQKNTVNAQPYIVKYRAPGSDKAPMATLTSYVATDKKTPANLLPEANAEYAAFLKSNNDRFKPLWDDVYKRMDQLRATNAYYSPGWDSIMTALRREKAKEKQMPLYRQRDSLMKTGNHLTDKGKLVQKISDSITAAALKFRYAFITAHVDQVGFYLMEEDALYRKDQPNVVKHIQQLYPAFAAKFPYHPYTTFVGNIMRGYLHLVSGGQLIDFSIPDLHGKVHRISDLAKGRVTLLDFWGSWCGSCIANSKLMMPVYKSFKDKGFQVIGIAREYKNTKALNAALKRDNYPWLNLLEMDDKHAIWNKYGISNQGGMMILLDADSKILAIDPSAEQVHAALTKIL